MEELRRLLPLRQSNMKPSLNYWVVGSYAAAGLFFAAIAGLLLFSLFSTTATPITSTEQTTPLANLPQDQDEEEYLAATVSNVFPTITFTGDIMMARSVERWMNENGADYPFRNVAALAASSSAVVSNFEAAISEVHIPTPPLIMRFSVDQRFIPALRRSGVTHVSLANNHTLDYGQSAYRNTRAMLAANDIVSFGHSTTLSTSSITYIKAGSTTVSILAIHTLFVAPNPVILRDLVEYMKKTSDVQLAFIHWGTEYKPSHDAGQATLANYLVTLGIDAIIGHHPHVVEDVQLIGNVPVFYSLGNFIFDQYFSTPVQLGLVLRLDFTADNLVFTLLPVTSLDSHGQPRVMNDTEKATFLANLSLKSAPALAPNIKAGKVIVPLPLVKKSEDSMI